MTQQEASLARKDIWGSIYTAVDMSYYIGEGLTHYKTMPEEDDIDVFRKRQYKCSINENIDRVISAEASLLSKLKTYINTKTSRCIILNHFNAVCDRNFKMGLLYHSRDFDAETYNQLDESYTYNMRELHKEIEKELMGDE